MNMEKVSFEPQPNWIYYALFASEAAEIVGIPIQLSLFGPLHGSPSTPFPVSLNPPSAVSPLFGITNRPSTSITFPHFHFHGHRHRRPPARLSNIPLIPRKITSSRTILARPLFLHRGHLGTTGTGGAGREREQRGPLEMMVTVLLAWHSRSRESLKENGARAEGDLVAWPAQVPIPLPCFTVSPSHQHRT